MHSGPTGRRLPSQAVDGSGSPSTCSTFSAFSDSWQGPSATPNGALGGRLETEVLQVSSRPGYRRSGDFCALESPVTLLGGGKIDPFRVYPVDCVGRHAHELIDHRESPTSPPQCT